MEGPGVLLNQSDDLELIQPVFFATWYMRTYDNLQIRLEQALLHYFFTGAFDGHDPNPFFSSSWYISRYLKAEPNVNPLVHYMRWGAQDLLSPSPQFDAQYYVEKNPEAANNPLLHFLEHGIQLRHATKGPPRALTPAAIDAGAKEMAKFNALRAFDVEYYTSTYSDINSSLVDPFQHFLEFGAFEGRRPNPYFDSAWYLSAYPDVLEAGYNPLVHYMNWGESEGRRPFALFDPDYYTLQHPDAKDQPFLHFLQVGSTIGSPTHNAARGSKISAEKVFSTPSDIRELLIHAFDADFYRLQYPDIAVAVDDPLGHYLQHGASEGRNPNAFFDSAWYLRTNEDIAVQQINPLVHYMKWGASELRDPSPDFDALYYAAEFPEASCNPLVYHLQHGQSAGAPTVKQQDQRSYLPSIASPEYGAPATPVDVIIPIYRGLQEVQDCLTSLLSDPGLSFTRLILIDDHSPEPELSKWLLGFAAVNSRVSLLVNKKNRGFVGSVNRGVKYAKTHDVVLLNSDTIVPHRWLQRLRYHAYQDDKVATVTPLSNNATICSYPNAKGGPIPFELTLDEIDDAAQRVNAGRSVPVPTGVGFCMFIRRDCLHEIGRLDEESFGKGYGEEVDFCLRASARGWDNRLACDVFVYHAGEVSFGKNSPHLAASQQVLRERYPTFEGLVARHVRRDEAAPYRFCLTVELALKRREPRILHISHSLGGGIKRHIDDIARLTGPAATHLSLTPDSQGFLLSLPGQLEDPVLAIPKRDFALLAWLLGSIKLDRIHIHHVLDFSSDLKHLVSLLGLPFDFTIHDFYTVCPRINFLQFEGADFCGQPAERICNLCISASPSRATDIITWRMAHRWLLQGADRLIAPSEDTRRRLQAYGVAENTLVVNHDFAAKGSRGNKRIAQPPGSVSSSKRMGANRSAYFPADPKGNLKKAMSRSRRLGPVRVGLLGVLAEHKGLSIVRSALKTRGNDEIDFVLIGSSEACDELKALGLVETGSYRDEDLLELIAGAQVDILWFPARWPETYSYTLTAGLQARLPIVASRIGAFEERLANKSHVRLLELHEPASEWIRVTKELANVARTIPEIMSFTPENASIQFYKTDYLAPNNRNIATGYIRTARKRRILVLPERLATGVPSPCAYIRLVLPFRSLGRFADFDVELGQLEDVVPGSADVVVCHRHAARSHSEARAIIDACHTADACLLYDLDDQLIRISEEHPEFGSLQPMSGAVREMVSSANMVWFSTPDLASHVGGLAKNWSVCENAIDGDLWDVDRDDLGEVGGPIRIGYMGTATHAGDFSIIASVAERVTRRFADRVQFEIIGVTSATELPEGFHRVNVPAGASRSYPLFIGWFRSLPRWDLGLAPLARSPFNNGKSAIKCMDYAAGGFATLASDHAVYKGSIADGLGGMLLGDTVDEWEEAICRLVANRHERRRLSDVARSTLKSKFTLSAQREQRLQLLQALL